jgi:hypothetical protein
MSPYQNFWKKIIVYKILFLSYKLE